MRLVGDAQADVVTGQLRKDIPNFQYTVSPDLVAGLAVYASDLAGFVAKELADGVRSEVLIGVQRGETIPQITKRVQSAMVKPAPIKVKPVVDPATGEVVRAGTTRHLTRKTRAELIARTETNRAIHQATVDAYKHAGVEQVNIVNPNADEECLPFINQNPWPIDEAEGLVPIHHNCRCTLAPVIPEA